MGVETGTTLTTAQTVITDGSAAAFQPLLAGWFTEIHMSYVLGTTAGDFIIIETNVSNQLEEQQIATLDQFQYWVSTTDMVKANVFPQRVYRFLHPGQAGTLLVKRKLHKKVLPSQAISYENSYKILSGAFANENINSKLFMVQEVACKRSGRH